MLISTYAGLLGLIFLGLTVQVIRLRRSLKVALGCSEHSNLQRAISVHANFAEYVPLALLLIGLAELKGLPQSAVHLFGGTLVLGRALHAYGVSQHNEDFRLRVSGMAMTLGVIALSSLSLLAIE